VTALVASPELPEVLGLVPVRGRWFRDGEGIREVVLTGDFARRAWGGELEGARMELDGVSYSVVGVVELPEGYPEAADLVLPFAFSEEELSEGMRGARYLEVLARLAPGADAAGAEAELNAFLAALGEVHPAHRGWGTEVVGLVADLFAPYRPALALLLAAGAAFLLLAGINVVGLVAAQRAEGRQDRAVRRALGATEGRLLGEATLEGVVAGFVGAAIGLTGAAVVVPPIRALVPVEVPRLDQVSIGIGTVSAILIAGLVLGAVVGCAAWLVSLGGGGSPHRSGRGSAAGLAVRRALVVGQLALTTLLVAGGAAILDHVRGLRGVDMGFDGTGVQVSHVALDARRLTTDPEIRTAWVALQTELRDRGLNGAVGTNPPVSGSTMRFGFRTEVGGEQSFGQYHSVTPDYLDVLSIPVLEGRAFSDADDAGSEPVVLINEALARSRFPGEPAVGRVLEVVGERRRIVGVVASTRHFGPDRPAPEELYVPLAQDPWAVGHLLIATDRADVGEIVRSAVGAADPALDPPPPLPFDTYLAGWYAPLRLQLAVVGVLGVVGLVLAVLGLYAVVAVHVTGRRKEIGIRMALGARGRSLFGEVLMGGVAMALLGAVVGGAGWLGLRPLLEGVLPGSTGSGAGVVVPVAFLVVAVSALAAMRPAWRSTQVDPGVSLQEG
jgi:predicted permease